MGVPATAVEHKMRSQGLDEASIARARALRSAPAAPRRGARGGLAAAFPQYDRMLRVGLTCPRCSTRCAPTASTPRTCGAATLGGARIPPRAAAAARGARGGDARRRPAPSPAAPRRRATMTLHWDKVDARAKALGRGAAAGGRGARRRRRRGHRGPLRPGAAAPGAGVDVGAPRVRAARAAAGRGASTRSAQNATIAVSARASSTATWTGSGPPSPSSTPASAPTTTSGSGRRCRATASAPSGLVGGDARDAASWAPRSASSTPRAARATRAGLDTALAVSGFDARLVAAESAAAAVLVAAAVLDSGGLARALRHILAVGNAMNAGTARGDAVGVTSRRSGRSCTRRARPVDDGVGYAARALSKRGHAPEVRRAARTCPGSSTARGACPSPTCSGSTAEDAVRGRRAAAAAAAAAADLDGAVADEEMENMAEHEAPRFFDTFTKSAGFSLFRAAERRRSRSPSVQADAARRRGAHAVAGRRVARLGAFVDRSARAAARLRRRVEDVTSKVDALCDYFGEDDSTKILEDLHVFLRALVAALAKADDEPGAARDADYDMAGGRDARRRILGRREALFPSNAQ
ncbi:hypothetical protein JL721_5261 [Aureococcus anophagefferens]|nr:hypothetical protein JL721_5261 [Aureococcus anophagefferens]